MILFCRNRLPRNMLLASASAMLAGIATAPMASAAPSPLAMQDLGALPDTTPITVTLWLQPHDPAAFTAALDARTTFGSPEYHHWMTPAEVASYGATAADAAALETSLRAQGLTVLGHATDNSAIRATGSAAAIGAAFGTALHQFSQNGTTFYRAISTPAFIGAHAEMIAGITGLTNAHLTPFVLHQLDFTTGKPVPMVPAAVVNPNTIFTTNCFNAHYRLSVTRFAPGGATHGLYVGPRYKAGGFPSKTTCGYTPAKVAAHYGMSAVYSAGYRGDGQTIVLVDAYGSPTILSDANLFSKKFGLPPLTGANFSEVFPDGQPTGSPYPTGWPTEISLDVEWAHALAPDAKIVLVVAPTDDESELTYALHYAAMHQLGDVISNSYGYAEASYGPAGARAFDLAIREAAAQGIAVNVATGDSGDLGLGTPVGAASIPADSPHATAVGGTSLNVPGDNGPVESAWGITATFLANLNGVSMPPSFLGFSQGGGGGESVVFEKPSWQKALAGTGRELPDVSAVADPQTGAIIVTPSSDGTETVIGVIGGTSLASPVFSGIWALADQAAGQRLGQAAPIIAAMPQGAVTDVVPIPATKYNLNAVITKGTATETYNAAGLLNLTATQPNGFVGTSATFGLDADYDLGFGADSSLMAAPGWDNATGYGVPNGLAFIQAAAAAKGN